MYYKGTVLIVFIFLLGVFTGCRSTTPLRPPEAKALEPGKLYVYFGVDTMALLNSGTKDPDTGKTILAPSRFSVRFELDESVYHERVDYRKYGFRPEHFYSKDDKQWIVQPMNLVTESMPLEPGPHRLRVIVEGDYLERGLSELFNPKRITLKFYSDPIEFESTPDEAVVLRGAFASSSIELNTGLGKGHVISNEHNTAWHSLEYNIDGDIDLPEKEKLMTATERAKWFVIREAIAFALSMLSSSGGTVAHSMGNKDFQMHTLEMRFYQVDDGILPLKPERIIFPDQISNLRLPPEYWMKME